MSTSGEDNPQMSALTTLNDDSAAVLEDDTVKEEMPARKGSKRSRIELENDLESPPKKKQTKVARGNRGKLSLLPTMPLDILHSIFSYLHPRSLITLSRVNRSFRTALLSPENTFIWTRIRKACQAPDPCEDLGEVEWVRLLFGKMICQSCGKRGQEKIDFILLQRICIACVKANGVSKKAFKQVYPNEDKKVLDLVQSTAGGRKTGTYYYSLAELNRVLERMKSCKDSDELREYMEARTAYLARRVAHAELCYEWADEDRLKLGSYNHNARQERIDAIVSRLKEMGFVVEDIQRIADERGVINNSPLTERSWNLLKDRLSDTIMNSRIRRLLSLHRSRNSDPKNANTLSVVTSRCSLITQRYLAYKRTEVSPSRWPELPLVGAEAVFCLPSMRHFIGLPDEVNVTASKVQDEEDFAEELDEVIRVIRNSFLSSPSYPTRSPPEPAPTADVDVPAGGPVTVHGRCRVCGQVCTSVHTSIRHMTGRCYLSVNRGEHVSNESWLRGYFKLVESRAAIGLLQATFGDVENHDVSADEMDERGEWFRCLECLRTEGEEFVGTWRDCVDYPLVREVAKVRIPLASDT
ncbi:hypothetical protein AAF712_011402 [Marasmius tenuissimus]|uniref:F-box domain-containing protein n=1 Tax=Marasmius tenuissimus TaxID=585030 RepID=A0ABR2ZJ93_9AGAR